MSAIQSPEGIALRAAVSELRTRAPRFVLDELLKRAAEHDRAAARDRARLARAQDTCGRWIRRANKLCGEETFGIGHISSFDGGRRGDIHALCGKRLIGRIVWENHATLTGSPPPEWRACPGCVDALPALAPLEMDAECVA